MVAPNASESWIDDVFDAVVSEVQRSNYFRTVIAHEPKRKPGHGLTAAIWVQNIAPFVARSGLSVTSGVLIFIIRIYSNMLKEPQDAIDPEMLRAVSNLMRTFHDDFDFDLPDIISNVDLLGAAGTPLNAQAGYLEHDTVMFRIYDITLPLIIHDVWPQAK